MEIGVMNTLIKGGKCFDHVSQFGLNVCQLVSWDVGLAEKKIASVVVEESRNANVRICAVWAGVPGPAKWNILEGPATLGLVPLEFRWVRIEALKKWADFAAHIGAPAIITHCGFIPEDPLDPNFRGLVVAVKEVAEYCARKNLEFWFETGQETPFTLLRTIERVGTKNLGINFDPANLILYGKGNPIDAIDVFGKHVRNLHIKDGFYPTNGYDLGQEVKVGDGKVNYPGLLGKLKNIGFDGELIIEREISGDQQIKDIRETVLKLEDWLESLK